MNRELASSIGELEAEIGALARSVRARTPSKVFAVSVQATRNIGPKVALIAFGVAVLIGAAILAVVWNRNKSADVSRMAHEIHTPGAPPRETVAESRVTRSSVPDLSRAIVPPMELVPFRSIDFWELSKPLPLQALAHLAAQGDANAAFELGRRYALGQGVKLDLEKAKLWFMRSGAGISQLTGVESAYLKLHGFGADQDLQEAYDILVKIVGIVEDHGANFSFAIHILEYLDGNVLEYLNGEALPP